jgi:hypothetical protein
MRGMSVTQVKAATNASPAPRTIVPKHGNGVLRPIQPGEIRNPGGKGGLWQATQRFCREKSPQAAQKLYELLGSDDERIVLMAADKLLYWGWGRPPNHDPNQDRSDTKFDLSSLSLIERRYLLSIIDRTAVVDIAPPEAQEADGQAQVVDAAATSKRKSAAGRTAMQARRPGAQVADIEPKRVADLEASPGRLG